MGYEPKHLRRAPGCQPAAGKQLGARAYATAYADRLLTLQDGQGFFPAWLDPKTFAPSPVLAQSPETSMSVTFLLELALITGEKKYHDAAIRAMDALLVLRNESVDVGHGLEAWIGGEHVYIGEAGQREAFTYFSIATALSPTTDIDIRLGFALLGGEMFVYWQETYLHRMYRQGLFRIDSAADWPDRLTPYCAGEGGEWISH